MKRKHIKINTFVSRLVISMLLVSLLPTIIIGYFSFSTAQSGLETLLLNELSSTRQRLQQDLTSFLVTTVNNLDFLAETSAVKSAYQVVGEITELTQDSASPEEKRLDLGKRAAQATPYLQLLLKTWMEKYSAEKEYQDVLAVVGKNQGYVFSMTDIANSAKTLDEEPLKNSSLTLLWEKVKSTRKPAIVDFSYLREPMNSVVAFVGVPVMTEGEFAGMLCVQMGPEHIEKLLHSLGLRGETGDAFLLGEDLLQRSAIRGISAPLLQKKFDIKPAREAFQNLPGTGMTNDFGTTPVLMSWSRIGLKENPRLGADFDWSVFTKIDAKEALQPISTLKHKIILIGFLIGLLAVLIGFVISRNLARPVSTLARVARDINRGDLTTEIPRLGGGIEIGELGSAFGEMIQSMRNQTTRIVEGISILRNVASEISVAVSQVVSGAAETSTAVTQTTTTVEEVRQTARIASEKGKDVAHNAQKATDVSTSGIKATEDTRFRINVIRQQMDTVRDTVVKLTEKTQAIEKIIETVQDLADQSNLLAVNASIEAARAGDHGKGFGVVAHEIKTLADQSKIATQEIRTMLYETKQCVSSVAMATEQGAKEVESGVELANAAGSAIQDLTKSVTEFAQTADIIEATGQQQSAGVDQVSDAMVSINKAMRDISDQASGLESSAKKLSDLGSDLHEITTGYKV
jgi:methyl-accepting chemotaxis protein